MLKLIAIGLSSGLFFSSTFVLNELMSAEGGHWVWSGALRYFYMILFLAILIAATQGWRALTGLLHLFAQHWVFWVLAGGIGFGAFYALICFSADYSPGWVIAATWQITIIATLFVLMLFGRTFPRKVWLFSALIFAGVLMINISHITEFDLHRLILGGIPVLVAAFCYPLGNQLVWEAKAGRGLLPRIESRLIDNPFNKVFLMSVGSLPLWFALLALTELSFPSRGQMVNTALVALLSGVLATTIFLYARSLSATPFELAAVDATQSSEVIFAMLGSMILLQSGPPNLIALTGLSLVFGGLLLFIRNQNALAG